MGYQVCSNISSDWDALFLLIVTSRYGGNGEKEFKKNLPRCLDELRASTTPTTIILWLTALPISAEPNAAVFDEKCQLCSSDPHWRCIVVSFIHFAPDRPENKYWRTLFLHTNAFSAELAKKKNCEVLDLHYLLRQHPDMRDTDGCHWNASAHRFITSYMSVWTISGRNHCRRVSILSSAQTISLIWHVPYIDRLVFDHKERDLHRFCHQAINELSDKTVESCLNELQNEGIADFDLNTYLAEYIPITKTAEDGKKNDDLGAMLEKMNETDQRILHLMNYYEKQS